MELHAEYFLKCSEAAKWLNTPEPVTGIPKEFLDGAHAITTSLSAAAPRPSSSASKRPPSSRHSASHSRRPPSSSSSVSRGRRRATSLSSASSSASTAIKPSIRLPPLPGDGDREQTLLESGFPDLASLVSGKPAREKSLLYVPVELHEHFVFGVALGCVVPPPQGVRPSCWKPLVNRFVLDAGRKCCLMFSYFAEGSIVVSVDCFDEVGDHFWEITFFEPTPVVGVFPRGIRGRMQIFEKKDCPKCTRIGVSCSCPVNQRIEAIIKERRERIITPERGPAHAGSSYRDENVIIQTYPYWAQVLDEYKWSRTGNYCIQMRYTPAHDRSVEPGAHGRKHGHARGLAYRSSVAAEPRANVEKMLRVGLFDQGVSALKPPATDVRWQTSSTVTVNSKNEVRNSTDSADSVCVTDWHKLPGFQEDYLLVAPSNIVSGAHARAELARAEAAREAAEARNGVPVLPTWASGNDGVFAHIMNESGPEMEMARVANNNGNGEVDSRRNYHAEMLRQLPMDSVRAAMGPSLGVEKAGHGHRGARTLVDNRRRHSHETPRERIVEGIRRSSVEGLIGRSEGVSGSAGIVESNVRRRVGLDMHVVR